MSFSAKILGCRISKSIQISKFTSKSNQLNNFCILKSIIVKPQSQYIKNNFKQQIVQYIIILSEINRANSQRKNYYYQRRKYKEN